jgi:hypothetical protein
MLPSLYPWESAYPSIRFCKLPEFLDGKIKTIDMQMKIKANEMQCAVRDMCKCEVVVLTEP